MNTPMSLRNKTINGILWVSISNILLKFINFTIIIILARLLEPSDFGLIAIALIIVNFFENFRDLGIGPALIYRNKDRDIAADTAFYIFPAVALIFYAVSYFIAPVAAVFFREEDLEILIRVLSFTFVIWSFGNLPRTMLTKDLEFKKLVIPQILPKISYGAVAIVMALQGYGIWSLVGGRLVLEVMNVITIWKAFDWRPSLRFDWRIGLELISYGKYVIIASIIFFLLSVVDVTFIGRLLGSQELGYYSIAFGISGLFTYQVSSMLSQVMFPVFSKIQGNMDKLGSSYFKMLKYVSLIAFPAAFGIIAVSWYFIKIVYGDKWLPAVAVLQVLCLYGLNRAIIKTTENLYLAAGKPRIMSKINFYQLVIMLILIYPLTIRYGIIGTGIAAMIPSAMMVFLTFHEAGKIIDRSFLAIVMNIAPAAAGSLIMVSLVLLLQQLISHLSPALILLLSIGLGAVSYCAFLWLTQKDEVLEIKRLIGV
ncbi:MAG: MOP flippase family protein [ANME-2 cluster archaeon]|nr:MAG: MOP flippase family protein [ANME-2 cluster archaeon]